MKIRCLIVDDDEMARQSVLMLCEKLDELEVVGICKNAAEVVAFLDKDWADLIFLDIEMPGWSGLDLVRETTNLPYIVFISSKTEHAIDAFDFKDRVVDFVPKPPNLMRLKTAVDRVASLLQEETAPQSGEKQLFIRSNGRIVRIDIDQLLYIETVGDYVNFQTSEGQYLVHSTLKRVDHRLQHPSLMKVHRSFIVNLSKIKDIEENTIVIDRKVIPVSRQFKPLLLRRIDPI